MVKLVEFLSHFDILLLLSAIASFIIATVGKIAIPKALPLTNLSLWQRTLFGVISLILFGFALLPLWPLETVFPGKMLGTYDSQKLAAPDGNETTPHTFDVPSGKRGLLMVTARGFSLRKQAKGKGPTTPTFQIGLKLDDKIIGSNRASWYFSHGTARFDPTISTSAVITAGPHTLQIVFEQQWAVQIEGTQLSYQLLQLD